MKKWLLIAVVNLMVLLSACSGRYQKFQANYTGSFDINTNIIAFARSKAEFDRVSQAVSEQIEKDNRLFDIYNGYDGTNNMKTINDNAGVAPVAVDTAILDLLEFSVQAYNITGGTVNVAMGPVLHVWHDYRTWGNADKETATLPPIDELRRLAGNTDIGNLVIDRQAGTVFLTQPGMSLDVGAVAKGFTAQRALDVARNAGIKSILINMGGNVVTYGKPLDGRDRWAIGIQNPSTVSDNRDLLDIVYKNDIAIVSSGDYQRFYTVDGQNYNHIIDPHTLMPAKRFSHVTVLHPDSGMADLLSTAIFILPQEDGRALLEQNGAEGLWVNLDGSIEYTDGFAAVSQKFGGYSAKD